MIVEHYTVVLDVLLGLEHVRLQRARRRAARAARRVRALHRRHATARSTSSSPQVHLPPHGRAQRPRDRHRARRLLRRRDPRPPRAAARLAAPHALAAGALRRSGRRDVIGHAESLSSPYHHERVARLRTQTHGDFDPRRHAPLPGEAVTRGRPRPPRRDRVEPLRPAHRQHRPAAAPRRARRRRARSRRGSPGASSRSCSARRCSARAAPPSWPASATAPRPTTTCSERDYGEYEGLTTKEIRVDAPGLGRVARRHARRRDARAARRARRPRDRARAGGRRRHARSSPTRTCCASSARRWIGLGPDGGGKLRLGTAALSMLGFERERRVILRVEP